VFPPVFLLDTNVVSELRRPRPHGAVLAWLRDVPEADLHLSVVTLGELQAGVEILRSRDAARATEIERWLEGVSGAFNILDMDAPCFRCWARLMHRRSGDHTLDAMIAATAIVHRLTVVTRNVKDFEPFGVQILDPFAHRRE